MTNLILGRAAEAAAACYLEARGWTILERNWRTGHLEVDIIAARAGVVAFVEVKARRSRSFGHPLDAITRAKRRALETAARVWLASGRGGAQGAPLPGPVHDYRFDALWIIGDPAAVHEIEHVPNAWRL